jgi:nucleoside-diphosphate-sugar epimerase
MLVTGASGFVGTALTERLLREGRAFRIASRQPSAIAPTVVIGDLASGVDWSAALDGVDTVLHLAGRAHIIGQEARSSDSSFHRVNVDATKRLALACAGTGVRRLVFLSSAKVMGDESGPHPFVETDSPHPIGPYAISKWQAEQALLEVAQSTRLSVVILRSPLVYGPGVRANFLALLRAVDRGIPLPFAAVRNLRSLIALENLVDALLTCSVAPSATSEVYFARDSEDLSTPALIRLIADSLGRRPRLLPIPTRALRLCARLVGRDEMLTRLIGTFSVDPTRITERLGWHPKVSSADAIDATVRWYRGAA